MRLDPAFMYDRFKAGDPNFDGRFFTGVVTTGIYCLPSCKARKPKPENVRFFPSCEAARAAGLRPCRKCHPDDFARGADPVLETIEALVAEVRANPAEFADAAAIVRRSGFGTTRLFELVRRHFQATPAELLLEARLERSKALLLGGDAGLAQVAFASGFESLSVFHAHFRARCGLTPAAYRELRTATRFVVELPGDFPMGYLRRALSRDPNSLSERLAGDTYEAAVRLVGAPALLTLRLGDPGHIEVLIDRDELGRTGPAFGDLAAAPEGTACVSHTPEDIEKGTACVSRASGKAKAGFPDQRTASIPPARSGQESTIIDARGVKANIGAKEDIGVKGDGANRVKRDSLPIGAAAHAVVAGLLGLDQDAPAFARLAKRLGFARLVEGRTGLRVTRTLNAFDGLLWAIIGQQINFAFACLLKRRLTELAGQPLENGLRCPPSPEAVAALDPDRLKPLQFSRRKAEYLIGAAKLVASGDLALGGLKRLSATRAERVLLGIHGLGPWSVNYLMMKSLGFSDCVPLGDTGVASGLKALFALEERPDIDATRRLMAVFSPYRSLATFHLWQLLQSPP